ncbi:bifunctional 4-hydroxy-3-methylbut-2-enyl diphosphate reductase/30S ribosomal protein S1 [Petroclostridium sp. X23]|uniref:bifunctional 4-hydroxy-3-methylbut-2-enyl diphosphate reductase/30S ribosomal protein S1 n=1 Tax=Petroclostridium sp. X23 TaxID=3045146 RepID=UPI0024AD818D|nr:bifunctional 4-hydroxy-3-methylbut-2-enyl diphosphate reductase/30S ribosomal protein S1 [Petroclostridium sp. X23]WHH59465.1 bifunctional 4-hydroxy-3-methylbut-2-enyl diphosphate reductase/30S ribosomal protein S1 [Petroclostridium sp. X23]
MEIIIAKTAGFCFGVNRAIDTVYENVKQAHSGILTLGPIIHNQQVVDDLKSKGVGMVESITDISDPNAKIIIRTHGIGKSSYTDLEAHQIDYIDATCPYVKKIHRIVEKYYDEGYQIVIVGDENHPEVIGINGWCENSAIIVCSIEDIEGKLKCSDKTCVVAQTTINRERWDRITDDIKQRCQNPLIYDTICSATNDRQVETEKLAKQVDIMIVIGGKHSSNTQKLAEICRNNCKITYHIETFEELPQDIVYTSKKIGITAGASTPAWIIKEVIDKMSEKENLQNHETEMSFAEAFEQSLVTLNTGDIVEGTVIGVSENEVYVDLGFKSDGVIKASELTDDPSLNPKDLVKVGDPIKVFIIRVDDGEGNVLLSKKKIDAIKGWEEIESSLESKKILTGKVIEAVNGGIIVLVNGIRVFVPASQASDRYITDLNQFLKREVSLRIIDINKKKRRTVGSIRVVLEEEQKIKAEEFWQTAEIGKKYTGAVKKLADFGAFVDLGGVDGLIHISELSWKKIKHPSQVLKEGDMAEVYILELDKEKNRISLGFKKAEDNPWEIAKSNFNEGDVVKCKVVRMVPFGAFVELIPGVDGLIHISQISNKRIGKPEDVLALGSTVEAKITSLDFDSQKISLSIRELLGEPEPQAAPAAAQEEKKEDQIPSEYREDVKVTIGDMLNNKTENN